MKRNSKYVTGPDEENDEVYVVTLPVVLCRLQTSRLSKRQLALLQPQEQDPTLIALDDSFGRPKSKLKKPALTAEELEAKKLDMKEKRKFQSHQMNEDLKNSTIEKLLISAKKRDFSEANAIKKQKRNASHAYVLFTRFCLFFILAWAMLFTIF